MQCQSFQRTGDLISMVVAALLVSSWSWWYILIATALIISHDGDEGAHCLAHLTRHVEQCSYVIGTWKHTQNFCMIQNVVKMDLVQYET